jgi:hypothetical protein
VLGRHVPQLSFLEVLLGDEPVLLPEQCFYQRLLATDQDEARALAEAHLKENSLESMYDSIILPALKLAEQDTRLDALDEDTRRRMLRNVKELIEDLGDQYAEDLSAEGENRADRERTQSDAVRSRTNIACVAAGGGADGLVAMMLVQLLRQAGFRARELRADLAEAILAELSQGHYGIVCVSSISPFTVGEARSICRRLQARLPSLRVVIGLWSFQGDTARQRLGPACAGSISTTLSDALAQIRRFEDPANGAETLSNSSKAQQTSA